MIEPIIASTCEPGGEFILSGETAPIALFFAIGLLGGAHCLGMCGPLAMMYGDRMNTGARHTGDLTLRALKQHTLFNLGRSASYAVIGGLFGLAGSLLFLSADQMTALANDVHAVVGTVIGILIITIGISYLSGSGSAIDGIPGLTALLRPVQEVVLPRVENWVNDARIVGLGAAHGTLPCPLTYPAYLYVFLQGSPLRGAVGLGVLGLGTIPAMFIAGTATGSVSASRRKLLHRVLGALFIVLGYLPLQHGLAAMGIPLPHPPIPFYQPL